MRVIIITFTGITIGIIIGISSVSAQTINTTPIHQSFTTPAIKSVGYVVDSSMENILVSFDDHLVRFEITDATKINRFVVGKTGNEYYVPIQIDEINNKMVYIIYSEINEKLFASKIIAPK